uniref:metallophosphoesterase n=1 Tax=uncultured Rhizobium sp. TaxID=155567 RepID=UPI0026275747|nr:metallophosphoesterase [uncultured Rhizobium sp.]
MRLWVFSDLHLAFADVATPLAIPAADVCVVAGDIHVKGPERSIAWLAEHVCPHMPVVFVAGNHEFYHAGYTEGLAQGREVAAGSENLHFLENAEVKIDDVVFAGATLWTDFEIMGHCPFAMHYCETVMNDFYEIAITKKPRRRRLRALHTIGFHRESRKFIEAFLYRHRETRTVVVTHHAPSKRSVATHYENDITSAAFASDMSTLITERGPTLWVHGHVHDRYDYRLGKTRVLCNPRGYPGERNFVGFDFGKVVEV